LLLKINKKGNLLTNWIDKTGRGLLLLKARNHLKNDYESAVSTNQYSKFLEYRAANLKILEEVETKSVQQYHHLYRLFNWADHYLRMDNKADSVDKNFKDLTKQIIEIYKSIKGVDEPAFFLNSIFFEIIKDYLLLSLDDKCSGFWRRMGSFNLQKQYIIFFELCPSLKVNWDTSHFKLDFDTMERLKNELSLNENPKAANIFKHFFLDRLSHYLVVKILENGKYLPHPTKIQSFEELILYLPALSGMLHHHTLEQMHGDPSLQPTIAGDQRPAFYELPIFSQYLFYTNEYYKSFYSERGIFMPIKSNICATEEIGLTQDVDIQFYDLDISEKNKTSEFHTVIQKEQLNISIEGISHCNGFTKRSKEVG